MKDIPHHRARVDVHGGSPTTRTDPALPIQPSDATALLTALGISRDSSQMFLHFAVITLQTDGAAGTLRIHIPRRTKDQLEVEFFGLNPHPNNIIT